MQIIERSYRRSDIAYLTPQRGREGDKCWIFNGESFPFKGIIIFFKFLKY